MQVEDDRSSRDPRADVSQERTEAREVRGDDVRKGAFEDGEDDEAFFFFFCLRSPFFVFDALLEFPPHLVLPSITSSDFLLSLIANLDPFRLHSWTSFPFSANILSFLYFL